MKRRAFLATGVGTLAALSGCLDVFAYDDPTGDPAVESDRPAVNETFVAGPMEPYCERNGGDYPPMSIQEYFAQSLPESRDVETVEAFARRQLPGDARVTLREERPARLGWRGETFDIASRYNSERYFVGWVGEVEGDRAVVVVLHESYAELRVFETSPNC